MELKKKIESFCIETGYSCLFFTRLIVIHSLHIKSKNLEKKKQHINVIRNNWKENAVPAWNWYKLDLIQTNLTIHFIHNCIFTVFDNWMAFYILDNICIANGKVGDFLNLGIGWCASMEFIYQHRRQIIIRRWLCGRKLDAHGDDIDYEQILE